MKALALLLFLAGTLYARPAIILPEDGMLEIATDQIQFLEDPAGSMAIEDAARSSAFATARNLDRLPPGKFYWLKMDLQSADASDRILEAYSDFVSVMRIYYRDSSGQFVMKESGMDLPFSRREIAHRYIAFRIPGTTTSLYAQVRFNTRQHFRLIFYSEDTFNLRGRREQLVFGLYYGTLIIMALYNLFVCLSLRSLSYLYYVLYIVSFGLYQTTLNGIFAEYFSPTLPRIGVSAGYVFAGLSIIFSGLFARQFLGVRGRSRIFNFSLLTLIYAAGGWILISFFAPFEFTNASGRILGSFAVPIILTASVWAWRTGYRPARYFFLAWSLFLIGVLLFTFTGLGIIPHTPVSRWSMQIGSAIEALLLSLALGDRINTLREAKDRAESLGETMRQELQIARRIQESILPEKSPEFPGLHLECRYLPATEVGGDFYDFCVTRSGVGILIVDVCGHGVPAALIASMVKVAFASHTKYAERPDALLHALSLDLAPRIGTQFITAAYAFINYSQHRLTFCSAGHPPVVVWRAPQGVLHELTIHGPVIGWPGQLPCPIVNFNLESGDRIVMYTDGIFEQRNRGKELFGFSRFHDAVKRTEGRNAADFTDQILEEVLNWSGTDHLEDDVTLCVIDVA